MGLEFRRGRDGEFLPNWYGRVEVDGKSKVVNLKVKVRGQRPPTRRQQGDALFEASREQAQDRFDEFQADARDKGSAAHLTKRLIQFKTGRKVEYVKLGDLAERWRLLGRENQPTESWLAWCDTIFRRFAESVPCKYLHEVTPSPTDSPEVPVLENRSVALRNSVILAATTVTRSSMTSVLSKSVA